MCGGGSHLINYSIFHRSSLCSPLLHKFTDETPPPAKPSFDDGPSESDDQIVAAYEELHGPAYNGITVLGNDIHVMDSKLKKATGLGFKVKDKPRDGFDERVVQVRRVTKVVKGGKQLHFRAIVVVRDKHGRVISKSKEVVTGVQKSAVNARRNIVNKNGNFFIKIVNGQVPSKIH